MSVDTTVAAWEKLGIGELRPLTATENERGWVTHACPAHGALVVTMPSAVVNCRCGKVARIVRNGRVVDEKTLRPTSAKATELNAAGHPNLYACGDCGADFGGHRLQRRHRVGGKLAKRCMSPAEMEAKGWFLDARGRWRARGAYSPTSTDFRGAFPQPDVVPAQIGSAAVRSLEEAS